MVDVMSPVIIRSGVNEMGDTIRYFLNYSGDPQGVKNKFGIGHNVFTGKEISEEETIFMGPWDVVIIEYQ